MIFYLFPAGIGFIMKMKFRVTFRLLNCYIDKRIPFQAGRRAGAIDNDLLKELYLKYGREIYRYIYAMCQNHAVAQDLTQDTFLKALLSLSESHTNMKAWLYMVARNLYLNHQKKEKAHVSWGEQPPSPNPEATNMLSQIMQDEDNAMLFHALSRLSRQKREILQLQYFGGFSQKEIAAILHLTPGNVRVLALRAKRELKQYLEANDYDIS